MAPQLASRDPTIGSSRHDSISVSRDLQFKIGRCVLLQQLLWKHLTKRFYFMRGSLLVNESKVLSEGSSLHRSLQPRAPLILSFYVHRSPYRFLRNNLTISEYGIAPDRFSRGQKQRKPDSPICRPSASQLLDIPVVILDPRDGRSPSWSQPKNRSIARARSPSSTRSGRESTRWSPHSLEEVTGRF